MTILDKLEKHFSWLAIPNLTVGLIIAQVFVYIVSNSAPGIENTITLLPYKIYSGEWWRILTFLFVPPSHNLVILFFTWYFFYFIGKSLEEYWGDFKYTLYIFSGWLATTFIPLVIQQLFSPLMTEAVSNGYLMLSIFLAFAHINPDYKILLMFILPVKIKWLAWLAWFQILLSLLINDWGESLVTISSVFNFLIFFGNEIYINLRYGYRYVRVKATDIISEAEPVNRCEICGATEISNPEKEFRYCSKCSGRRCYCLEHLQTHTHITN